MKIRANINDYLLLLLSLVAIFGALLYYLYALNWVGIIVALVLALATWLLLVRRLAKPAAEAKGLDEAKQSDRAEPDKAKSLWLFILYGLLFLAALFVLYQSRSERALISPWQVVSARWFVLYALSSLALIFILIRKSVGAGWKIGWLSLHYFLSLAVALIVYRIGYGFDPFIHSATMELIDKTGAVFPKPPYYVGAYALIIILHKLSGLSIFFWNQIFVPLLTALFLPLAAYRFLRRADDDRAPAGRVSEFLTVLLMLGLTFSPFIVTTPQNLTYLFLILTIFWGLRRSNPWPVLILAVATTAIHPLTGLPALAFAAWLFIRRYRAHLKSVWRRILLIGLFIFNALALPLALFFTGGGTWKEVAPGLGPLIAPFTALFSGLSAAGQENWLLNAVYFFAYNYNLWLLIIIVAGLAYFIIKTRRVGSDRRPVENGLIFINLSLVIAYVLSSQLRFNDLINYEQANYANRLLVIMAIFFLPFVLEAINRLIKKIRTLAPAGQIIWLIFAIGLLSAAVYVSYPRFDRYFNSRGYSTGASDIKTVDQIARDTDQPYIVLANQQVSAAALKEFGFDHYYQTPAGPIYFYPIPTGGPLYQYYLDMVYKNPDRATMDKAMKLIGTKTAYLAVNRYWFQSDRVIGLAKLTADRFWNVSGEVYIFKYTQNGGR